jgi:hypothetical protein
MQPPGGVPAKGDLAGAGITGAASQDVAPVSLSGQRRVVFDTNVLVSLYVFADSRFAPLRSEDRKWRLAGADQ